MSDYTLSTTPQTVGKITVAEGSSSDRYFEIKAYYGMSGATTANVYVQIRFSSQGGIYGDGNAHINQNTEGFTFSSGSTSTLSPFSVSYVASNGHCRNNSLTLSLSDMDAQWSDGTGFDATPQNSVSLTFDLPDIDPAPNANAIQTTATSGTYTAGSNTYIMAGLATIEVTLGLIRARKATLSWSGAGISGSKDIDISYSTTTQTITEEISVPASASNYTLHLTLDAQNNTGSVRRTASVSITGYSLPTYGNDTYSTRCDSSGVADPVGEHGKLHLTWNVTQIDSNVPNTIQNVSVTLNGTAVDPTSEGTGYKDYIFALSTTTQGNLEIVLRDALAQNTITSIVIPKMKMPLSLYQEGDSIGVTIGRMATDDGFRCYEDFYIKEDGGNDLHTIGVNSSSQLLIDGLVYGGGGGGGGAVESVNGKTGNVILTASDVGALPNSTVIPTKTSDLTNDSNFIQDSNYVHTDNNFTTTLKNKLNGIASGAEVNVQSDWAETDSTSDAYIQNKPTINNGTLTINVNGTGVGSFSANQFSDTTANITVPTKTSDLTNDSGYVSGVDHASATTWGTVTYTEHEPGVGYSTIGFSSGGSNVTGKIAKVDSSTNTISGDILPSPTSTTKGGVTISDESDGSLAIGGYKVAPLVAPMNRISSDFLPDVDKWNGVTLEKTATGAGGKYVPVLSSTSATTAGLSKVTTSPNDVGHIPVYDGDGWLYANTIDSSADGKAVANKTYVDTKVLSISVPTKTSDLTNDSGFITIASVPTKTSDLTNDSNFVSDASYVHTDNNFTTTLKDKLDGIESGADKLWFGECSTAASTSTKSVTITGFPTTLSTGLQVAIKFTNANSISGSTSPKLQINGCTAVTIVRYGTTTPGTSANESWQAGSVVHMIYDGSYWVIMNWLNTTYGVISQSGIEGSGNTVSGIITGQRFTQGFNARISTYFDTDSIKTSYLPDASATSKGAMSSADFSKLSGIESGAEVNVQSNWNETDSTSDAYILNKPTIPTKTSDLTNDDGFITGITSSDVTTALGYTPYNSSNPNGYTSNTGTITGITMNGASKGTSGVVNLGTVLTAHQDISGKLDKSGGTMTGQLKTSYRESVAMGSYGSSQTTVAGLVGEVRYSSGCMGSVSIGTAYTKDGVTIPTGWYNFIYSPHRSGGVNGSASGDNCNYGSLLLMGMTVEGVYRIRVASASIAKLEKLVTTADIGTVIKGYQLLTGSSSSAVANHATGTITLTITAVSGASDYILIPQRCNYGFVTAISRSGTTITATVMNSSGASHTMACSVIVLVVG